MARVSGYQCDICKVLVTGSEFPSDWISVKLPGNGDSLKELCGNKCLLTLAKGRNESSKADKSELSAFFKENGLAPQAIGPRTRKHVNERREMDGPVEDCLICRFELERS